MVRQFHTGSIFYNCNNIHDKNDVCQFVEKVIKIPSNFKLKFDVWDKTIKKFIGYKTISCPSDFKEVFDKAYHYTKIEGDPSKWIDASNVIFKLYFFHGDEQIAFSVFEIELYEVKKFSEISFGNCWYPTGSYNEIYYNLENRLQDLLKLGKEIYYLTFPSYGYLGEMIPPFLGEVRKLIQDDLKLPVINWVNYFGPSYVEKYGEEFLLNAPGYKKEKLKDGGVFYQLSPHFLIYDHKETPSEEEIIKYFTQHTKIKRIKYKPLFVEEVLPMKFLKKPPKKDSKPEKQEKTKYTPEKFREMAEKSAQYSKENLEMDLDFTPESLKKLDEGISKYFDPNVPVLRIVPFEYGTYLGEVVIRNLGGRWEIPENPWDSKIVDLPGIDALFPFIRMAKRFDNGEGDSVSLWYEAVERVVKGG